MKLIEKLTMRACCIDEHGYTDAPIIKKLNEVIDRLNSIDAVSVVRCRKCHHYEPCEGGKDFCCLHRIGVVKDDFCSYGERKEGEE